MSYDFIPMTDEELNKTDLLKDGEYNFEVFKSERKPSAAGNPMAKLTLKVWDHDNTIKFVTGYLVFSNNKFTMRIVKHFCESVGLETEYEKGSLPEELNFYCGRVFIKIEKGNPIPEDKLNGKPLGTCYPDKNVVVDYIPKKVIPKNDESIKDNTFDDVIPF